MASENRYKKGNLVLIGGSEDRRDKKVVLHDLVTKHKLQNVIVIPTATLYPLECSDDYYYAFRNLGVKNIEIFDIRDRHETEKAAYFKKLEKANMVFFTGGDQVRLTHILLKTKLLERIRERFLHEKLVIAGTSAGAAAAANPMTFDGDEQGLIKGTVSYSEGFGFIDNLAIDTHFVARGRLGRLSQFLCSGHTTRGIGIGENTAVTISPDGSFYVTGSGIVTMVSTQTLAYSNFHQISNGQKLSLDGIRLSFLQEGARFDLNQWKVLE